MDTETIELPTELANKFFPAGTIVKLKSGGPAMTSTGFSTKNDVECTWFDNAGKIQSKFFQRTTIRKVTFWKP